jgi:hypothetical protein
VARGASWRCAAHELAWSDGAHSGAGQLQHWSWRDYLHCGPTYAWLIEHQVDLGSSDGPATHMLLIDANSGPAWVTPMALAHRIVCTQLLARETPP